MTRLPLEEIRVDLRSHRSVLSWLVLLYRQPTDIELAARDWPRWRVLLLVFRLYLHSLPYLAVLALAGQWCLRDFGPRFFTYKESVLSASTYKESVLSASIWQLAMGLGAGLAVGLMYGLLSGPAIALSRGLGGGLAGGLAFGSFLEILLGEPTNGDGLLLALSIGLGAGLGDGTTANLVENFSDRPFRETIYGLFSAPVIGLTIIHVWGASHAPDPSFGLALGLVLALEDGLTGPTLGFIAVLAFYVGYFRVYYLPLHFFLMWPEPKSRYYAWHPVSWDGRCLLPFPKLHRLLAAHAALHGEDEIERLIDDYPAQRWQALVAKTVLVARRAARVESLAGLDDALANLPEGQRGFLAQTPNVRRKAQEITRLQARLETLNRNVLREPFVELLMKTIGEFEAQIAGHQEPLVTEFRRAAKAWRRLAEVQRDKLPGGMRMPPTGQVFRAGDPVQRESEAFLFRAGPAGELEQQVMLATGCPGLVIYGRRRMGKSTLVLNLPGFLPPSVNVLNLSMQSPRASTSLQAWVDLLEESLLGVVDVEAENAVDLMGLERLLERVNSRLDAAGRRVLLAIDEYKQIDQKIGQGVFPEDLLATVRESIQSHRHLTWAFVGSHRIDELQNAPWASYLVSARTVEVEPFSPEETRLLLTQPMKHSTLWRHDESKRPRFEPGFWGDSGIERIHQETGGWPHLVQLVAETVIDELNLSSRKRVDLELLEKSLEAAARRGDSVFHQLIVGESTLDAELDYLEDFADHDMQPPPEDKAIRRSLRRRLLVVPENGEWRLRAPIMARWLRRRL